MVNLCIIPARGGSKRIPRKNIKGFLGKPIIAYSIEAAINSKLFDEVMVSTDDVEIAETAKKYGAKVPFLRSKTNASDVATTAAVIDEVLQNYQNEGMKFDFVCCIYPCAPFVNDTKLKSAFELLKEKQFDTVFPVIAFSFPIQRALKITNNKLSFIQPEYALTRSQDLEQSFQDSGQFYWMSVPAFQKKGKIVTENCGGIVVSEMEAHDIDNEIDWKMAELKYKMLK
ncbi:MAG: pseudaminic acid cytidylyltransferase [Flavobacteriia bacterium]|nr:pseudaminic acid cytidylyltransferase [Flavobacteriia bacterium]OJX39253.1 MAG: pseudaminic acid cytidylyltransferase [Flavobacteriia bacterium 40-80]